MHLFLFSVLFFSLATMVYCRDLIPEERIRLPEQDYEQVVPQKETHTDKEPLPEKEIFVQEELVWVSEDYTVEYGVVSIFVDKPYITIQLPNAYSNARRVLYVSNKTAGHITVQFWEDLDIHLGGRATIYLKRGETKMFQSDGNTWILINL